MSAVFSHDKSCRIPRLENETSKLEVTASQFGIWRAHEVEAEVEAQSATRVEQQSKPFDFELKSLVVRRRTVKINNQ